MNKKINAAIAAAVASGIVLATPASAAVASYSTDFTGVTINRAVDAPRTDWRMFGPYDAEIADGVLRVSNAYTQSSFGDMLFSPALPVGAVEDGAVTTFTAAFTLKPVDLQPGLRVTVSPDDGDGGRGGFTAIEHRADGIAVTSSGSYFRPATDADNANPSIKIEADGTTLDWRRFDVVTGLDPKVAHRITIKLIKKPDTAKSTNNDAFSVKVDGKPAKNTSYEAYYDSLYNPVGQPGATDTVLFRISGTAVPSMADSAGLLIDDFTMSVE